MLGVMGLCLDLLLHSKRWIWGRSRNYCSGPGWSSGMRQAGHCAYIPLPSVCGTSQQPGPVAFFCRAMAQTKKKKKKNANVTRDSVSGWLSFGEVSRRGHSSCSHQWPIDVWAGLGMFLHPPRSVGWGGLGGGGEGALTPPPASPVCPATPAGRGRGDRGMGLMSAPHQARVTPSSSSPWSPGTSSPRWWPGPPSARGTSCTPSLMKPLTCT